MFFLHYCFAEIMCTAWFIQGWMQSLKKAIGVFSTTSLGFGSGPTSFYPSPSVSFVEGSSITTMDEKASLWSLSKWKKQSVVNFKLYFLTNNCAGTFTRILNLHNITCYSSEVQKHFPVTQILPYPTAPKV